MHLSAQNAEVAQKQSLKLRPQTVSEIAAVDCRPPESPPHVDWAQDTLNDISSKMEAEERAGKWSISDPMQS
jgi:hypothetical protein